LNITSILDYIDQWAYGFFLNSSADQLGARAGRGLFPLPSIAGNPVEALLVWATKCFDSSPQKAWELAPGVG